jgi:hypothetical protein
VNQFASASVSARVVGLCFIVVTGSLGVVRADDPRGCAPRTVVVKRMRPAYVQSSGAPLGTFYPTPVVMIGGAYPTASTGYSPLESYGDTAFALYGPLSAFRVSTAPVLTYTRGYDGQTRAVETNSFSYPNLPSMSPVVYPTEANYYWGPRTPRTPRWGSSAINWIDQN